tara:strand:- start:2964 stop:4670 length:1707 start_codon:yes stop_codon:yes gene_type:complete
MTDTEQDYDVDLTGETEDEYDEGMDADYYMSLANHQLDSQQQFNYHMSMILEGYIYGGEEYIRNHDLRVRRRTVATPTVEQLERFFGNIEIVEGSAATRSSYPYNHVEWEQRESLGNILNLDGSALTALWDDRIQLVEVRGYEEEDSGRFYRFDFDNDWIYAHPNQNDAIENAINRMENYSIGEAFNDLMESEGLLDPSNQDELAFTPLEDVEWADDDNVATEESLENFRENVLIGLYYEFESRGGEDFDEGDFQHADADEREAIIPNFNERTEQLYNWWREQRGEEEESIPSTDDNIRTIRNILLLGDFSQASASGAPIRRRVGTNYQRNIFPDGAPPSTAPQSFGDFSAIKQELQEDFYGFMNEFKDSLLRANVYGFWRGINMKPTFRYANYDDWNSKKVKLIGGFTKQGDERLKIVLFNRLFEFYDDCYKRRPGACRTHRVQFENLRSQLKGVNDIYVMNTTVVPQEVLRPTFIMLYNWIQTLSAREPRIREEPFSRGTEERREAEDDDSPVAETEAEPEPTVGGGNMVDALFARAFEEDGADAAFLRERYARNLAAFNALNLGE